MKQKYFNFFVLVTFIIIILLIITSKFIMSSTLLKEYTMIHENKYLMLYLNEENTQIAVYDKFKDKSWFSNPDNKLENSKIDSLNTQFTIEYYTPRGNQRVMNNYNDSIKEGQFNINLIDNGVSINYKLGREYSPMDLLPTFMSKKRYEKILNTLENETYKEEFRNIFTNYYTLISLEPKEEGEYVEEMPFVDLKGELKDYKFTVFSKETDLTTKRRIWDKLLSEIVSKNYALEGYNQLNYNNLIHLKNNPTYMLDSVPRFVLNTIVNTLVQVGYTIEDKIIDNIENFIDPPGKNLNVFELVLEYTLENDNLVVRVPNKKISFPKDVYDNAGDFGPRGNTVSFPLTSISLLENFGSAGLSDEGYIFVPDGSGALIELNSNKNNIRPYVSSVYGKDHTLERSGYKLYDTYQIYLPVFGIKKKNSAFFSIIEKSAAMANVKADIAKPHRPYNIVNAEFILKPNASIEYDSYGVHFGDLRQYSANIASGINVYQSRAIQEDVQLRYAFLYGKDANYVGMAKHYQNYLVNNGLLNNNSNTDIDIPFFLELVGGAKQKQSILGFPRETVKPLTTYNQAEKIISNLLDNDINNIKLKYIGWLKGGAEHEFPLNVNIEKKLGTEVDFINLIDYTQKNKIEFFPEVNFLTVYYDRLLNGFSRYNDTSRTLTKQVALHYDYNVATFLKDTNEFRWILSPRRLNLLVEEFLNKFKGYSIEGLALKNIGKMLNADYQDDISQLIDRNQSVEIYNSVFNKIRDKEIKILTNGANMYSLSYLYSILNLPYESNNYYIIDRSIPFFQIVVKGYINYAGVPINMADNYKKQLLKTIETGGGFYYQWSYAGPEEVKNIKNNELYSIYYNNWIEDAVNFYQNVNNSLLRETVNEMIINHKEIKKGVFLTQYENNINVIVNYNNYSVTVDNFIVPAEDFIVYKEGLND